MNEQQLADLFSEQLDRLLQGQEPVLPANSGDLPELLSFGQQFSQINFQPGATAQAAFQSQLTTWFGSNGGGFATLWGLSKTLLVILSLAVVGIGTGIVMLVAVPFAGLPDFNLDESDPVPTELPAPVPLEPPVLPASSTTEAPELPVSQPTETKGDVVPLVTSSTGDTLPLATPSPSSSLGETLSLPAAPTITTTAESSVGSGVEDNNNVTGGSDNQDAGSADPDDTVKGGDDDRGHGNDADGFDEDNPGNSSGLPGSGTDDNQGNNSSGLDMSDFSRGDGGNGGGQGGGNGQGKGKGKGSGGGQGQGRK